MSRDRRSSSSACAAAVFTLFIVSASWRRRRVFECHHRHPGIESAVHVNRCDVGRRHARLFRVSSRSGRGRESTWSAPGTRETESPAPPKTWSRRSVMLCLEAQGNRVSGRRRPRRADRAFRHPVRSGTVRPFSRAPMRRRDDRLPSGERAGRFNKETSGPARERGPVAPKAGSARRAPC